MSTLDRVEVVLAGWNDKEATEMRSRQQKELQEITFPEPGQTPSAKDVPVFLVSRLDGWPIACGGLRPPDPTVGELTREVEVKRMYVVPEFRARIRGVADLLMKQLSPQVLESGCTIAKIETGRNTAHPRKFYTQYGFKEIPLYGHCIGADNSVCYEKILSLQP